MSDFQRPRGTRDFPPERMEKRRNIEYKLRNTARNFGFGEVMTPTFENTELFIARSGPDIVDEMYAFEDKGGRQIALRPEITASVIRFYVNDLHTHPKPLKLYYMGNCFRYERPQSGRYREFFQFGAEIIGSPSLASDAEILALAYSCVKSVGLKKFKLRIGHLGVLKSMFEESGIDGMLQSDIRRLIDKKDFEGLGTLQAEADLDEDFINNLIELVNLKGSGDIIKKARRIHHGKDHSLTYLSLLLEKLADYGIEDVSVDFSVARGLDYYTGTVFEIDAPELGAEKQICGGGSYSLTGVFGGKDMFSTGFAFGFDRIMLAIGKENISIEVPRLDAYVIPVSESASKKCLAITSMLRENGISVDLELMGRKMGKALSHASSIEVKSVIIVGDNELAEGKATVRDMESGEQSKVDFTELAAFYKS